MNRGSAWFVPSMAARGQCSHSFGGPSGSRSPAAEATCQGSLANRSLCKHRCVCGPCHPAGPCTPSNFEPVRFEASVLDAGNPPLCCQQEGVGWGGNLHIRGKVSGVSGYTWLQSGVNSESIIYLLFFPPFVIEQECSCRSR